MSVSGVLRRTATHFSRPQNAALMSAVSCCANKRTTKQFRVKKKSATLGHVQMMNENSWLQSYLVGGRIHVNVRMREQQRHDLGVAFVCGA